MNSVEKTNQNRLIHRMLHLDNIWLFLFAWIPYTFLVYNFRWVCDDAFISFRFAKNFVLGHGLRYNIGNHLPVEGYSNFLWLMICAVFEYFKVNIWIWPILISYVCGSLLLYLVFITLSKRFRLNKLISFISILTLACSPSFIIWSTSGLATVPFALLIYITFDRLVLRPGSIAPFAAGASGLALALIRVDGIYWAIILAILSVISRKIAGQKIRKEIISYLTIVITGYMIYWACRYAYYQLPFANSVYIKAGISSAGINRGLSYVITQFLIMPTLFIIVPSIFISLTRPRSLVAPITVIPLVTIVYSIIVGGDFMPFARFLVPALAFNALLVGLLLDNLFCKSSNNKLDVIIIAGVIITISLLPIWDICFIPESFRTRFFFRKPYIGHYMSEKTWWIAAENNSHRWSEKGIMLKNYLKPGDTVVEGGIGAAGYYSELFIYDRMGLVNRSVATRKTTDDSLAMPGHDKVVPFDFFFNLQPTVILTRERTKERLRKTIINFVKNNENIAKEYVADIFQMSTRDIKGKPLYLILFRRISEGSDPQKAWEQSINILSEIVSK